MPERISQKSVSEPSVVALLCSTTTFKSSELITCGNAEWIEKSGNRDAHFFKKRQKPKCSVKPQLDNLVVKTFNLIKLGLLKRKTTRRWICLIWL